MQCMLRKVSTWCTETGLKVDPDKIKLVVFTRKHKVPTLMPPSLARKKLEAKDSVKSLGVILDRMLNWDQMGVETKNGSMDVHCTMLY